MIDHARLYMCVQCVKCEVCVCVCVWVYVWVCAWLNVTRLRQSVCCVFSLCEVVMKACAYLLVCVESIKVLKSMFSRITRLPHVTATPVDAH